MKNTMLDPIYQTMIGFENMLNRATTSYPPYNLYKDEDCYVIEIAVSGWKKSELEVSLTGTTLTVKGTKEAEDNRNYLVRGLAHRSWTKTWTLEPDIHVSDVELTDGILYIELAQSPKSATRKIDIN